MKLSAKKLEIVMASKMITGKMLSEKSGISETTISRIRNGTQESKPITIGKLAKTLQCEVTELIEN